jgi:hypothetical protein
MLKRLQMLGVTVVMIVIGLASPLASEAVNTNDENVAILGYDPVAYFTESEPLRGDPQFEHVWQDALWHFASAEHRDMFAADPRRYAPRYGGFCAGAMALGWKAPIDPEAWVIIEDRLYLAFNTRGLEPYKDDTEATIAKADANWDRLGRTE